MSLREFKRKLIKNAFSFFFSTGLLRRYENDRLRCRAVVLMYHRVLAPEEAISSDSHNAIIVHTSTFEKQMQYLKANYRLLSLDRFLFHLDNGVPFESKSCLITFDDGWRDNYLNAYPILKKLQIPAVIFLPAGFIGSDRLFWQERLSHLLKYIAAHGEIDRSAVAGQFPESKARLVSLLTSQREITKAEVSSLVGEFKAYSQNTIETILDGLTGLLPEDFHRARQNAFLSWNEINEMAQNQIDFGAHSVNHTILTVDQHTATHEIAQSKRIIENQTGKPVQVFSYPNGNYSEETVQAVRECGYNAAFSTAAGSVSATDNPYTIKRYNLHENISYTIPLFSARINGLI